MANTKESARALSKLEDVGFVVMGSAPMFVLAAVYGGQRPELEQEAKLGGALVGAACIAVGLLVSMERWPKIIRSSSVVFLAAGGACMGFSLGLGFDAESDTERINNAKLIGLGLFGAGSAMSGLGMMFKRWSK